MRDGHPPAGDLASASADAVLPKPWDHEALARTITPAG
jgi:hypothetical protein